jgi:hypothetical protein
MDMNKGLTYRMIGAMMLLFLFLSCEKDSTYISGRGKIKIAFLDAPYGAGGANRSAGAGRSETVVVPLEGVDGWSLCATLEEDRVLESRALRGFAPGALIRITVYDSNSDWVSSVLGTIVNGAFEPKSGYEGWDVSVGTGYTFVAYSLNSSTEDPGDGSSPLGPIDPIFDLVYGMVENVEVKSADNDIAITLYHQFSQVAIEATTTADLEVEGNILAMSAELLPGFRGYFDLSDGSLTAGGASVNAQVFSFSTLGATTVKSDARTVYTDVADPLSLVIPSVTIDGVNNGAPLKNGYITFPFALDLGTSYTLKVSFQKSPTARWAGSNIYWDGKKLTFDPMGVTENALYQGVYFLWGSLVGISAEVGLWNASSTILYVPTYDAVNPKLSEWSNTIKASSKGWDWTTLPAVTPSGGATNFYLYNYNISNTGAYANFTGDICQYIGETGAGPAGYRLPNSSELGVAGNWSVYKTTNFADKTSTWTGKDPGGTAILDTDYLYFTAIPDVKLPPSGVRVGVAGMNALGQLAFVGVYGAYWTGSTTGDSQNRITTLYLGTSGMLTTPATSQGGLPVRCFKED